MFWKIEGSNQPTVAVFTHLLRLVDPTFGAQVAHEPMLNEDFGML